MDSFDTFNEIVKDGLTPAQRLDSIWKEQYKDKLEKDVIAPLIQRCIRKKVVTFISINPSLPPSKIPTAQRGFSPKIKDAYQVDSKIRENSHCHYHKFYDIGKNEPISNNWAAIELLYIRDSTQANIENLSTNIEYYNFIEEQIRLTFDILEKIEPLIVVIANAGTDRLIHKYGKNLGFNFDIPSSNNGNIYRIQGIPFIIKESRYLGSSQWVNRDKKENYKRRNRIVAEIQRVVGNTPSV